MFQAIYSSPLRRAWHTAQIIGDWLGSDPIALPDLREMNGGEIEGLKEAEWQDRYPDHIAGWRDADNLDFGWPGGETRRGFQARAVAAITALAHCLPLFNSVQHLHEPVGVLAPAYAYVETVGER